MVILQKTSIIYPEASGLIEEKILFPVRDTRFASELELTGKDSSEKRERRNQKRPIPTPRNFASKP
jgi:hypothetical protein